jgi:hypothetical protein
MAVKYDVFVGHSTKDKAVARPPAERLRKDGLKVPSNFGFAQPGMSAHAFGSDWAQLEADTFQFRDPLDQEPRFIPLRLDDAPIKGLLAQFHYINWCPTNREQEWLRARKKIVQGKRSETSAAELVHELDSDGKQLRVVKHTDYTAEKVRALCASPDELRARWANAGQRADRHRRQHVPAKPCDATYGGLACAHAFC